MNYQNQAIRGVDGSNASRRDNAPDRSGSRRVGAQNARIALYARVSKALEQNPENQLIPLRQWAHRAGVEIVGEFVDEISSKDTRPQKESVLGLLRTHQADGVAFYALDRWGRNMTELVMELEEFSAQDWMMMALKEQIDLSSAAGRMFAHILAAMANFERERIRERTRLGLARVRAQGKKLGRPRKLTPPADPPVFVEEKGST